MHTPDECSSDLGCDDCDPANARPVEDFENGYCTELSGFVAGDTLDWRERANSAGFPGIHRWLKLRYGPPGRLEAVATRESPFLARVRAATI